MWTWSVHGQSLAIVLVTSIADEILNSLYYYIIYMYIYIYMCVCVCVCVCVCMYILYHFLFIYFIFLMLLGFSTVRRQFCTIRFFHN